MKKYSIIASVFTLFFIGCAKVSPTPDTAASSPTRTEEKIVTTTKGTKLEIVARPAPQDDSKCYTITNTEKATGLVEYQFSYIDGENRLQIVSLEFGQSNSFSSKTGAVRTNFSYFLIEGGGYCGPR